MKTLKNEALLKIIQAYGKQRARCEILDFLDAEKRVSEAKRESRRLYAIIKREIGRRVPCR